MRHWIAAVALAASLIAGCAAQSGALVERGTVMETARRISERYASAWNANDMNGFGALYTADARHVTRNGDFLRGRAAIVAAHRASRANYAASVRMVTRLEGARAITNDAIVSVMIVEYVNDPAAPNGIQSSRLTLTLVRAARDDWRIAQAHASQPG